MPALIARDGPAAGHRVEVTGETSLGRADSEFLQHDMEVSRRHAVLRPGPTGLEIEDLGSSNGTFVNDRRIEGPTALSSGDEVRLGQTSFTVEIEAGEQPTVIREAPARAAPPPTAGPEVPTEPQPALAVQPAGSGPGSGPPAYGPPPAPPAAPAYGPASVYPTGGRPAVAIAAGVVLLVVGLISVGYNLYDAVLLFGDLGQAGQLEEAFGLEGIRQTILILIAIDVGLIVAGILQIIGGIRVFSLSRAGRVMGLVGSIAVPVLWIITYVVISSEGLSLNLLAWLVGVVTVAGSIAAIVLLATAGRHFPPAADPSSRSISRYRGRGERCRYRGPRRTRTCNLGIKSPLL